jgi:hypothetical protein
MDAGPDALRTSAFAKEPPCGAVPNGDAELGPISPELALVDPELARRARELLPEPRERPRAPRPPIPTRVRVEQPVAREEVLAWPERQRRGWLALRMVVLAVVIFAGGAVSGALFGDDRGSPGSTVDAVRAVEPTTAPQLRQPQKTSKPTALRPPTVTSTSRRALSGRPVPQHRRHARVAWASNVIGVSATVDGTAVALVWQRPADSKRAVVLRKRDAGGGSVVVYRGQATTYRDASPRPCTGYRYTIVNYDRRGHRSTGVPTSIVTRCS